MKVNELFTQENGIFTNVFEKTFVDLFYKCFGDNVTAESLDLYLLMTYGERVVMPSITTDNVHAFVSVFIETNYNSWLQQANALNAKYDITNPVLSTSETEHTEQVKQTGSTNSEHTDQNFNDVEYTGGDKQTGESAQDRTQTGNTKTTVSGVRGASLMSDIITKEKELRQTNFTHEIVSQIIDCFTLKIY